MDLYSVTVLWLPRQQD